MISKELLSEVLGIEIVEILGVDKKNDLVYKIMQEYKNNDGYESKTIGTYINIYELAYKCKEWALDNGYTLSSNLNNENDKKHKDGKAVVFFPDNETYPEIFDEGTEYEAIFEACQWILDNKES